MASPTGAKWTVGAQTEVVDFGPDGRAVAGVRVAFVTDHGIHATVFVPKSQYSADSVRKAILNWYAHLDAVSKLTS